MRRFFVFAVLWTALFGPGHVLAACPMASATSHGAQAPCHSDGEPAPAVKLGHDCCSWVAPSGASRQALAPTTELSMDEVAGGGTVHHFEAPWNAPLLAHPPPLISPSRYLGVLRPGSDTFLRTSRLRL
jgi:hypothetical protein